MSQASREREKLRRNKNSEISPAPQGKQEDYALTLGPEHKLRPGTEIRPTKVIFIFNGGGMGDFINYTPALIWIAEHAPWILGRLYSDPFIAEFLAEVMRPYPHWQTFGSREVNMGPTDLFIGPEIVMNGQNVTHQLANATGSHLMDLGFQYYANMSRAPEGVTLPRIHPAKWGIPEVLRGGRFVCFTPGAITEARFTGGKHLNPLLEYCRDLGLLPVFLGRNEFAAQLDPVFADDIRWDLGIDLRNQTTLMQAAAIMEQAVCVLGLDNGLLHLASCTDANVIFGYNITSVEHREPRRTWGKTLNLSLTPQELACAGCQSNLKIFINHSFHRCYYGDSKCVDLLFSGGRFEGAIREMLTHYEETSRAVPK